MRTAPLITIAIILALSGCKKTSRPALSENEVRLLISGKYEGDYNNGVELFEIRTNGTFHQTFTQKGVTVYSREGDWAMKKDDGYDDYYVRFEPFMDMNPAIMEGKKPEEASSYQVNFYEDEYRDEPRITFGKMGGYFIVKTK